MTHFVEERCNIINIWPYVRVLNINLLEVLDNHIMQQNGESPFNVIAVAINVRFDSRVWCAAMASTAPSPVGYEDKEE